MEANLTGTEKKDFEKTPQVKLAISTGDSPNYTGHPLLLNEVLSKFALLPHGVDH